MEKELGGENELSFERLKIRRNGKWQNRYIEHFLIDCLAFFMLPFKLVAMYFRECDGCKQLMLGHGMYCKKCEKIKDKFEWS